MTLWQTPPTWVTDQVITAVDLNTYMNDNLDWLRAGKQIDYKYRFGSSDYGMSSVSYTAVDSTNISITLSNMRSGRALVMCQFFGAGDYNDGAGSFIQYGITCDGTVSRHGYKSGASNNIQLITIFDYFTSLSSGNHTFQLQYARTTGLAYVYTGSYPLLLLAVEL